MTRPIGIDLFSGAGGLSLGFEQAGFDVAAAVEIDPVHAAVHAFNFPHTAIIPRSVVGLSAREIRKAAGIGNKTVDVVFGGAPCQGFSLIGLRALDDPRNSLVKEFVRIVVELKASYFVFENVKGLTVGRHRAILTEIIEAVEKAGYSVLVPWRVLNAASFGVPQSRERLFLIGARKGFRLPSYPAETTNPADADLLPGLQRGPSCSDALDDLPNADDYAELQNSDSVKAKFGKRPGSYAREMRCLDENSWHFGYVRNWDSSLLTSSMRTEHSAISQSRFAMTPGGDVEPISRFFRLAANGVSNTLRAGTDSARGAFTSPRPIHHKYPRCVSVREMARLHGYPDWFRFHATKWHGARQVGNSVPPPLARAVASAIVAAARIKPSKPKKTLSLGDESLLRLDMNSAAKYWGVDVTIGRRDRKSGIKKRSQEEVEMSRAQMPPAPAQAG